MERSNPRRKARGAALPLAIILLGVLTVIAVTAVSLSTQERTAAGSYSNLEAIYACTNAATAKLWKEIAVSGTQFTAMTSMVSSIQLPDGTKLTAPAHYDTTTSVTVSSMVGTDAQPTTGQKAHNLTNGGIPTVTPGSTTTFTVTCQDTQGRTFEIELALRFAL